MLKRNEYIHSIVKKNGSIRVKGTKDKNGNQRKH